jgi:hypothetical protein
MARLAERPESTDELVGRDTCGAFTSDRPVELARSVERAPSAEPRPLSEPRSGNAEMRPDRP